MHLLALSSVQSGKPRGRGKKGSIAKEDIALDFEGCSMQNTSE